MTSTSTSASTTGAAEDFSNAWFVAAVGRQQDFVAAAEAAHAAAQEAIDAANAAERRARRAMGVTEVFEGVALGVRERRGPAGDLVGIEVACPTSNRHAEIYPAVGDRGWAGNLVLADPALHIPAREFTGFGWAQEDLLGIARRWCAFGRGGAAGLPMGDLPRPTGP